jgi:hypothetical protein
MEKAIRSYTRNTQLREVFHTQVDKEEHAVFQNLVEINPCAPRVNIRYSGRLPLLQEGHFWQRFQIPEPPIQCSLLTRKVSHSEHPSWQWRGDWLTTVFTFIGKSYYSLERPLTVVPPSLHNQSDREAGQKYYTAEASKESKSHTPFTKSSSIELNSVDMNTVVLVDQNILSFLCVS